MVFRDFTGKPDMVYSIDLEYVERKRIGKRRRIRKRVFEIYLEPVAGNLHTSF